MAQSGRFSLGVRVLAVLAAKPDSMQTSAGIAEQLHASAVMVRRTFLLLQKAGLIAQRKGPTGGARLLRSPKEIGLGDIFAATTGPDWISIGHAASPALDQLLKRTRKDAITTMNQTTLAQVLKRLAKVE